METMSLESQIGSIYPNLTKTEKKIADYVLKHIDDIGEQTLTQMSKASRVGEATIIRFIYKLGFSSLAQFKMAVLQQSISMQKEILDNTPESYAEHVYHLMKDSIVANSNELIDQVVTYIEKASHIYFFGNGTSGFAAEVAAYRFFRAGVSCEGITDVHMMVMKAAIAKEDELIFAISQSGDNSDIIDACKRAKCPIITVTGRLMSLLPKYGDINLTHAPISFKDKSFYGGSLGIIIQEFLMEMIFMAYENKNEKIVEEMHRETTISTNLHHEYLKSNKE